jgi:hypothetical protein
MFIRTSPYLAIGHVVCGLLILGACEAAHDGTWLIDRDWPPGRVSMYLTMAYYIGQFITILTTFVHGKNATARPAHALASSIEVHGSAIPGRIPRRLDAPPTLAELWRTLCVGLLVVAAILFCGTLWHGVWMNWGQSDWRKLGYGTLALAGAAATLELARRSSR